MLWTCLPFAGIGLVQRARGLIGHSYDGQVAINIFVPSLALASAVTMFSLADKLPAWVKGSVLSIILLAVVPLLIGWGGGI